VRIHQPLRLSLTACLGLAGLALAAGCSVAPAGATSNSPAIGPVRTGSGAKNFAPFPVPSAWNGQGGTVYDMAVKAKSGTARRVFSVTAASSLVLWLNCIGTGSAHLVSPSLNLKWGMPCGSGADPSGITVHPPRAARGKVVKIQVTSSPGARWEVRIDTARAGTAA
jgi:hypothetical protein